MDQSKSQALLAILRQKSTLAGLVGLVVSLFAVFDVVLTPEQSAQISQLLLALVSIVAIVVQPKPGGGQYTGRDFKDGDTFRGEYGARFIYESGEWRRVD